MATHSGQTSCASGVTSASMPVWVQLSFAIGGFGEFHRQRDPELGAARVRVEIDVTAMAVDDDVMGDVEAEPGADALRLGGEEWVEDPLRDLGWDARPGIGDADLDLLAEPANAQL